MEVDEDDEVIFENSALHHHLQDVGWVDMDISVVASKKSSMLMDHRNEEDSQSQKNEVQGKSVIKPILVSLWMCLEKLFAMPHFVSKYHSLAVIRSILKSEALEEEDAAFLENLVKESNSLTIVEKPRIPVSTLRLSSIFAAGLAYGYSHFTRGFILNIPLMTLVPLGAVGILALLLELWNLLQYYKWSRDWRQLEDIIKDLMVKTKVFGTLSRKGIRLIQEVELISRGFTIATPLSPAGRLELTSGDQSNRQCPQLRSCLFHVVRKTIMNLREATGKLIEKSPVDEDLDSISNYVAFIPLEQYGPCLSLPTTDQNGEQLLQQVTDGYSISALKALCHVCNIHISEYLRRIALCFLPQFEGKEIGPQSFENVLSCIQPVAATLDNHTHVFKRSYDIHKCSWKARFEDTKPRHKEQDGGVGKDIYTAVHSLQLHLQAAMKRLEAIENELEEDDCAVKTDIRLYHQKLVEEMLCVQRELTACSGCWEESMNRIDMMLPRTEDKVPLSKEPSKEQPVSPNVPIEPLLDMDSIIIEDQVFEAYTDPSEVEDGDFELLLSAEEKAKRKREKQEAVRLLNELKSVIGIRAKKWEERERKLMKKNHADKVPNKEEDESEETKSEVAVCAGSENDLSGSEKSAAIKSDELENGLSCDIVKKNYASDTKQTHAETDISLEVESETEQEKGENNKINNLCQRVYRPDSTRNNSDLSTGSAARRNPQDRLDSGSFSFAANIAAMAAARSRQQVQLSVQTYQDSDDSDDGDCIVDD